MKHGRHWLVLLALLAGGCARNGVSQVAPSRVVAAEADRAMGLDLPSFKGRWEFVRNLRDGRFQGSSVRSFHAGDCLSFIFNGGQFHIYGVAGPRGGYALVSIPGRKNHVVNFYAPVKRTHVLLYASPTFPPGIHSAALVVERSRDSRSVGTYVNVDELEIVKSAEVH